MWQVKSKKTEKKLDPVWLMQSHFTTKVLRNLLFNFGMTLSRVENTLPQLESLSIDCEKFPHGYRTSDLSEQCKEQGKILDEIPFSEAYNKVFSGPSNNELGHNLYRKTSILVDCYTDRINNGIRHRADFNIDNAKQFAVCPDELEEPKSNTSQNFRDMRNLILNVALYCPVVDQALVLTEETVNPVSEEGSPAEKDLFNTVSKPALLQLSDQVRYLYDQSYYDNNYANRQAPVVKVMGELVGDYIARTLSDAYRTDTTFKIAMKKEFDYIMKPDYTENTRV